MSDYPRPPEPVAAAASFRLSRRQVVRAGLGSISLLSLGGGFAAARAFVVEGPTPLRVEVPDFGPNNTPVAFPHSQYRRQFFLAPFPASALGAAASLYPPGMMDGLRAGFIALRQWCPYRDSRVSFCVSSGCFECPSCGSIFNRVGEVFAGPAKTGMVRFPMARWTDGTIDIDLDHPFDGLALSLHSMPLSVDGPYCVGSGGLH